METIEYTIKKEDDEEFEFFLKMNAKKEQVVTYVFTMLCITLLKF